MTHTKNNIDLTDATAPVQQNDLATGPGQNQEVVSQAAQEPESGDALPNGDTATNGDGSNNTPLCANSNLIKKRGTVIKVAPNTLTFHPALSIYNERTEEEEAPLRKNIDENGMLQRPGINNKGQVIIGGRRVRATIALGIPFIEVEVIEFDEDDAAMVVVESNMQRVKTNEELYRELKVRQAHYKKRQGQRTDLDPALSDLERMHTDDRLALEMNLNATKVSMLEKVGDTDPELLKWTDKENGPSLPDAYAACLLEKPKHDSAIREVDLKERKTCPTCGQETRRIIQTDNGKLIYQD